MGSFDATCILSDIGIGAGDKVACLVLAQGNWTEDASANWNPVSSFLVGKYDDYGRVALDEEPKAFLEHIRPWVVPVVAGANSVHSQAIDPDALDWSGLEEADHEGRLFLWSDESKKDTPRDPYFQLRKMLKDGGIDPDSMFSNKGSVYLHAVGGGSTGIYVVEPEWGVKVGDPLADRLRAILEPNGYSVHLIPKPGIGYKEGTPPEDYQVAYLVAPSAGTKGNIHFGISDERDRVEAARGLIRMDVLDAVFPVDDNMVRRAGLLREARLEALERASVEDRMREYLPKDAFPRGLSPYMFTQQMKSIGRDRDAHSDALWFSSEGSNADEDHIAPQILALPEDAPVEAFVPWVRLADVISTAKWWMRRGLRPTTRYVGSQFASEDLPRQLKYHRALVKVLAAADKARREREKRWR